MLRRYTKLFASAVTVFSACSPPLLNAATIQALPLPSKSTALITIVGDLEYADEKKFIDVALANPEAIVLLNSPGGNLNAGIEIGRAIRLKGYSTVVAKGDSCASACAIAWLGGRVRAIENGARIGFHAASLKSTGQVTSSGNALVGAYLSELRLPSSAIIYITSAAPDAMEWLTFEQAERYGIDVKRIDLPASAPVQTPSNTLRPTPNALPPAVSTSDVLPTPQIAESLETKSKKFVAEFYRKTSQDTAIAMAELSASYADNVFYYTKQLSSAEVARDKLSFFQRWPIHRYSANPEQLTSNCQSVDCQVSGVVSWMAYSPDRKTRSVGTSAVEMRIHWAGGKGLISAESSKVLSRDIQQNVFSIDQGEVANQNLFSSALTATVLPPYCHMDYCSWRTIETRDLVSEMPAGKLFKASIKTWSSYHPNGSYGVKTRRTGGTNSDNYVFCSMTKPAIAFESDGKLIAHTLAPDRPDGIFGYNGSDYILYFAACHGIALELPRLNVQASALGYRTDASRVSQIDISAVTDISRLP